MDKLNHTGIGKTGLRKSIFQFHQELIHISTDAVTAMKIKRKIPVCGIMLIRQNQHVSYGLMQFIHGLYALSQHWRKPELRDRLVVVFG